MKRGKPKQQLKRQVIESLEQRRMLASYTATSGNDEIEITIQAGGAASIISINGVNNLTSDTSITINAGGGNDLFEVFRVRSGITVLARGEGGNDKLLNRNTFDLDSVFLGELTFDGGVGTDTVVADNGDDPTTLANIDIGATGIVKNQTDVTVGYAGIEFLDYWDSNNGSRIGFTNMQGPTHNIIDLIIHGNGGNDIITNTASTAVSSGYWPTAVGTGGVSIDGGTGTDTLSLNNQTDIARIYDLQATSIDVSQQGGPVLNTGPLSYSTIESMSVVTSSGNDSVQVNRKTAATALSFNSGDGGDSFYVGTAPGDIDSGGFALGNTTLNGGAGNDSIRFDDYFDTDAAGETENYTLSGVQLFKGSLLVTYNSFESQTLNAANGLITGQSNTNPIITITGTPPDSTTTINVGLDRGGSINVTTGDLGFLGGNATLNLNMGGPTSILNINDQSSTSTSAIYEVLATQVRRIVGGVTIPINYSGARVMALNAGTRDDSIRVKQVPANTSLTVNAGSGNDLVTLGDGNIDADLLGSVTVDGGSGTNFATIDNSTDVAAEAHTLNGATFIDGRSHTINNVLKLTINEGPGSALLAINSAVHQLDVNGGAGADQFFVSNGDLDASIPPGAAMGMMITGGGGFDSLIFNDSNDTVAVADQYEFQRPGGIDQLVRTDSAQHFVSFSGIELAQLNASNAAAPGNLSSIIVHDLFTPLNIFGNAGSDSVQVEDTSAPLFVSTGFGDTDMLFVNSDHDAVPAKVIIRQNDDLEHLAIYDGGTLQITDNGVVAKTRVTPLASLTLEGVLDLSGGHFLSRAGGPTPGQWRQWIANGFNGGAWDGASAAGAVNSALSHTSALPDAVGYGVGSEITPASIGPFSIAPGDTLLRYTFYGDADLNGVVNFDDYARTDLGFAKSRTGWVNGDFNYDNVINFDDYALIDLAFNA